MTNVGGTFFYVPKHYRLQKLVGNGGMGLVASAMDTSREPPMTVAIKKISGRNLTLLMARRVLREISIMIHIRHYTSHIMPLHDLFLSRNDLYIVTPLMDGDLGKVKLKDIDELHIKCIIYQVLIAVWHLHRCGVMHRDIKPQNILVTQGCDARLCDFGLARGTEPSDLKLTKYVATRWYRAPEVLLESRTYGPAMDVWSIGCTIAELARNRPLFPGHSYIDQLELIFSLLGHPSEAFLESIDNQVACDWLVKQYSALDDEVKMGSSHMREAFDSIFQLRLSPMGVDLLWKMLQPIASERITIEEALRHPYFATMFDESHISVVPPPIDFAYESYMQHFDEETQHSYMLEQWREAVRVWNSDEMKAFAHKSDQVAALALQRVLDGTIPSSPTPSSTSPPPSENNEKEPVATQSETMRLKKELMSLVTKPVVGATHPSDTSDDSEFSCSSPFSPVAFMKNKGTRIHT